MMNRRWDGANEWNKQMFLSRPTVSDKIGVFGGGYYREKHTRPIQIVCISDHKTNSRPKFGSAKKREFCGDFRKKKAPQFQPDGNGETVLSDGFLYWAEE